MTARRNRAPLTGNERRLVGVRVGAFTVRVFPDTRGGPWLCLRDLAPVLGMSPKTSVTRLLQRAGFDLHPHALKGRFHVVSADGTRYQGSELLMVNDTVIAAINDLLPKARTELLREWWGGLALARRPKSDPVPEAAPVPEVQESVPVPMAAAAARPRAAPSPLPNGLQAIGPVGYAVRLTEAVCKYATAEEVDDLTRAIEAVRAGILRRRYCPGLNDAGYDLWARRAFVQP